MHYYMAIGHMDKYERQLGFNKDLFQLLLKIRGNYENLSNCEDIDLSDIIETILRSVPTSSPSSLLIGQF